MNAYGTGRIAALFPSTFGDDGGYGFIDSDDGEHLYFGAGGLQMSSVRFEYLEVGMRCRFTDIDHPKGSRAIEVYIADPNQPGLPL